MNTNTLLVGHLWKKYSRPGILSACLLVIALSFTGCDKLVNKVLARGKKPADEVAQKPFTPRAVDYDGLDFYRLEEIQKQELQFAQRLTGDDAGVHYAWAGLMTNLLAVRREMEGQAKLLADADILNVSTITNASQRKTQEQFIDRRKLANAYGDSIHEWEHAVSTLSFRYSRELSKWQVSSDRSQAEDRLLDNILRDEIHPFHLNERLALQRKICATESEIAQQYNYAVGSMETYYTFREGAAQNARLANRTQPGEVPLRTFPWETQNNQSGPNPILTDAKEKFEEQVAKIEKLKQAAQLLAQPSNPADQLPIKTATATAKK